MILYPSVDKLLERVDSRYKLIALGAKRAHELEQGGLPTLSHFDSVKPIGQAFEEIEAGNVVIDEESSKLEK
ncbi:DNA-directed RNA polymerase subunit omega [Weissella cibaria]|uniref:DNA-directed RNA polymerase subunit omega n=1 Tax=Weissella cibaria TaxID=137591 RepID=UPI0022DFEC75|nr:DNA-directed RNA polymerase subunit omega [Weissella cibaria]